MNDQEKRLLDLLEKANQLELIQQNLSREIESLRHDIEEAQHKSSLKQVPPKKPVETSQPNSIKSEIPKPPLPKPKPLPETPTKPSVKPEKPELSNEPTRWEEFIGTNLLNKIGIAILVIGIGFGVKYAIDHQLLNPLTRIILAYLASAVLLIVSIRLKKEYINFSAVLLSGSMASLYFVTYAAYDFYSLMPQFLAFVIMVLFTVFTVLASLQYNLQTIAIIGLVGAYGVPFLLSNNTGRVEVLFSYIVIINSGILVLSFFKNWKMVYYTAFGLTWLIFSSWYLTSYEQDNHFNLVFIFSTLIFLIFYAALLSNKLIKHESFGYLDSAFVLTNSFLVYGYGYYTLSERAESEPYLGLFTVLHAVIHFLVCLILFNSHERYKNIFFFIAGLVFTFLTIAVPVQLEGNWVTLIWASTAVLLFWIGRTKKFPAYESMAYPLMVVALISLLDDWVTYYYFDQFFPDGLIRFRSFLNIHFFTGLWVSGAWFVLFRLNQNPGYESPVRHKELKSLIHYGIPVLLIGTVYFTFVNEIGHYWNQLFAESGIPVALEESTYTEYNQDLLRFRSIWIINFSALLATILSLLCLRFKPGNTITGLALLVNYLVIGSFLTIGLYELYSLRENYLLQDDKRIFTPDFMNILIRYIQYAFVLPLIWVSYRIVCQVDFTETIKKTERVLFHLIVLAILSSELINWLDLAQVENTNKLGLTLLWGAYALLLIILGLTKEQKFIRVTGITLFAITILKLFLYDMAGMSTISKTLVMIILGALMLISSFLYNRSKRVKAS
jgi:uncharacterized membrane protein